MYTSYCKYKVNYLISLDKREFLNEKARDFLKPGKILGPKTFLEKRLQASKLLYKQNQKLVIYNFHFSHYNNIYFII